MFSLVVLFLNLLFLILATVFCIITELFLQPMSPAYLTTGDSLTSVFRSCRMSSSRSSLDKSTAFWKLEKKVVWESPALHSFTQTTCLWKEEPNQSVLASSVLPLHAQPLFTDLNNHLHIHITPQPRALTSSLFTLIPQSSCSSPK